MKSKFLFLASALIVSLCSCNKENGSSYGEKDDNMVNVTFRPSYASFTTKAGTDMSQAECNITKMEVFVYDYGDMDRLVDEFDAQHPNATDEEVEAFYKLHKDEIQRIYLTPEEHYYFDDGVPTRQKIRKGKKYIMAFANESTGSYAEQMTRNWGYQMMYNMKLITDEEWKNFNQCGTFPDGSIDCLPRLPLEKNISNGVLNFAMFGIGNEGDEIVINDDITIDLGFVREVGRVRVSEVTFENCSYDIEIVGAMLTNIPSVGEASFEGTFDSSIDHSYFLYNPTSNPIEWNFSMLYSYTYPWYNKMGRDAQGNHITSASQSDCPGLLWVDAPCAINKTYPYKYNQFSGKKFDLYGYDSNYSPSNVHSKFTKPANWFAEGGSWTERVSRLVLVGKIGDVYTYYPVNLSEGYVSNILRANSTTDVKFVISDKGSSDPDVFPITEASFRVVVGDWSDEADLEYSPENQIPSDPNASM